MKKSKLLGRILVVGLLFILFSCDKEETISNDSERNDSKYGILGEINTDKVFLGPEIAVGNGRAHSWITINPYLTPVEVGVEMTPEVLRNLPKDTDFSKPIIIPLPKIATDLTPFNHIGINLSPENSSDIESFREEYFSFYF